MKKRNRILAGVLVCGLTVSLAVPAMAEEDPMDDLIAAAKALAEEVRDPDSPVRGTIDGLISSVTNEDGSIDWDKAKEALGGLSSLAGLFDGTSEEDLASLDAYLSDYELLQEAEDAFVISMNEDFMDAGDVQLVTKTYAYMDEDIHQPEFRVLGEFTQENFKIEDNQMTLCSAAATPMLLTIRYTEDGGYEVIDAKQAEDGSGYDPSIAAFCEEVGISSDDYFEATQFSNFNEIWTLIQYMDEHPEITGAEFMGEIHTRDELENISNEMVQDLASEE